MNDIWLFWRSHVHKMNFKAEAKIPIAAVAMVLFYNTELAYEFWMMIMIGVR